MFDDSILIERRYCGPPNSANGGYACGRLAAFVDGPAEVTLHRPPPLEKPLGIARLPDGAVELRDGDALIATAKASVAEVGRFAPPDVAEAADAAGRTFGAQAHLLPGCFVCGPLRDYGDGLRIHVGPVDAADLEWNGMLAAPWVPADNLADDRGTVKSEFVWAALDCPTAYACGNRDGLRSILLGRQSVGILRRPMAGEPCVVAARSRGSERRKNFAEAVLFAAEGELLATCRATWIEVTEAVQKGAA